MKYTVIASLKFTEIQASTQSVLQTSLDTKITKQYLSDDSFINSSVSGDLIAVLRFSDLPGAQAVYDELTLSPAPTKQISLHQCYHDEIPPRPCQIIQDVKI